jgi:hypothetical protein
LLKFVIVAFLVATLFPSGQLMAQQSWEDGSIATALRAADTAPGAPAGFAGRSIAEPRADAGARATRAFFTNFIATMPTASNVPCTNCVNGTQANTLGIEIPDNDIASGASQTFLVSWTSQTFKGTCKVAVSVASGSTAIESFSHTFTNLPAGGSYLASFQSQPVTYTGPAIAVGKVTCGGTSSSSQTPVVFQ